MARVDGQFVDYTQRNNKGYFFLNSDKSMNPYTWGPPITWSGTINGIKIEFVQIEASGSHRSDYDFSTLPKGTEDAIDEMVKAIDDAMRTMD